MKTEKIEQEEKPKSIWGILILTILYLVSPIDLLPEALLGPLGFIDDAALFAYLIKRFLQR
ncbi:MAG: YkvA family protein [Calditrichia bacterium]